jgi:UDP:flavonoid glycosyltransferase YjiC (YdhE family)
MRILFSFAGGAGHLDPMLPIAHAATEAGHQVAIFGRSTALGRAGAFETFPQHTDSGQATRKPLLPLDVEREERDFALGFVARMTDESAARLPPVIERWRPDVVVSDETDYGATIVAERAGLPCASVIVLISGTFARPGLVAEPLAQSRTKHGLPPEPPEHLILSPAPPSFRDPAYPLPATAGYFHPPVTPSTLDGSPTVYVTLGTVFNIESGDLFARLLGGVRDLPVNVVMTVGRQIDPAEFGPQPSNVDIRRFVPQEEILPRCHAVVSHGGSGSVLGALAHGLPTVLVPMGADQTHNARRCAELGLGLTLDAINATPPDVAAAVRELLENPWYRTNAGRLRDEIAAMPGPDHAVALLERLAAVHGDD